MDSNIVVIVNLTPHPVSLYRVDGTVEVVPPTAPPARVDEIRETVDDVAGIPVYRVRYGDVQNLPPPAPGTIFIVSGLVLARVSGRTDVFAPGDPVRDEQGRVVGCRALCAAPAAENENASGALEALLALANDPHAVVRNAAVVALETLSAMVNEPNEDVRRAAL